MSVKVYSKPRCVQCNAVKMWLDKNDVAYDVVDVAADEAARDELANAGFQGVPVTAIDGMEPFYGFDIEKLQEAEASGLLR